MESSIKVILAEELYDIKERISRKRQKSLFNTMDRVLTGISPEDIIKYLSERKGATRNTTEKRRYKQDIEFIESETK